jgi:hypothetical protein
MGLMPRYRTCCTSILPPCYTYTSIIVPSLWTVTIKMAVRRDMWVLPLICTYQTVGRHVPEDSNLKVCIYCSSTSGSAQKTEITA